MRILSDALAGEANTLTGGYRNPALSTADAAGGQTKEYQGGGWLCAGGEIHLLIACIRRAVSSLVPEGLLQVFGS